MSRIDSTAVTVDPRRGRVRAASWAVFGVFVLNGFSFATWVSRIPDVRDALGLGPATIGMILLVGSLGSVCALPLAGPLAARIGTRRTVLATASLAVLGYLGVVGGFLLESVPAMAAAMAVACIGIAGWDVAMNLEGAMVEQRLARAIMPVYHAGFSVGTVIGAGIGALLVRAQVPVEVHLPVALAVMLVLVIVGTRWFLTGQGDRPTAQPQPAVIGAEAGASLEAGVGAGAGVVPGAGVAAGDAAAPRPNPFGAWLEPRTLLIGLLVLSAALTEGASNDWLSLAGIEAFDLANSGGTAMLTVFLVAMTVMRFIGTALLDRFGRVIVLRMCIGLAVVGLALFGFAPNIQIGLVGVVLWGLGAALGFPVGMSAASDDPARAAARVSVVSTVGYTAFLAGPPLLGLLAEHVGYRSALLWILVPLAISFFVVKVAAPPAGTVGERVDAADVVEQPAAG